MSFTVTKGGGRRRQPNPVAQKGGGKKRVISDKPIKGFWKVS